MPPPYHYEYTIHLGPGSKGLIEFWPDYPNPDTPLWTETFVLKEGELEKLHALLQAKGLLEAQEPPSQGSPPGAPADGLQATVGGRQISLPSYVAGEEEAEAVAEVYAAVKVQVPESLWAKLKAQYEQYQQDFLNREATVAATATPAPTPQRPADFSLVYHWGERALPPPYHYEYAIHLGPGSQGLIEFWPDYPSADTLVWTETFEVANEDLDKLYALMASQGLLTEVWLQSDDLPDGAPADSLQVTAEGRQIEVPSYVAPAHQEQAQAVYARIKALLPRPIWTQLMARYEQYEQDVLAGRQPGEDTLPTPAPTGVSAGTNEVIKTDTFEGVIFSAENAAATGIAAQGERYWTPSPAEVLALEKQLGPYLQESAPQDYPGPLRGLSEYKRQYVGILINEQPVIFVNFFCNTHEINWQREFVFIADGGSCYFEVKYEVETGEFSDLSIHGES